MDAFSSGVGDFLQQTNGVNWTADPNTLLVSNAEETQKLLRRTREYATMLLARGEHDFSLMRRLGEEVKRLSGYHDFSFYEELPPVGIQVLLLRALCELRGRTLADGGCTITGAFVDSYERVTGIKVVRTNIAGLRCWRNGRKGKELKGGAAGCKDPKGKTLLVLAEVKELHYLGLLAAGVEVLGIIAASNASIESFFGASKSSKQPRFTPCKGSGTYEDIDIFCSAHPKFVSPRCSNTDGIMRAFDAVGEPLKITSKMVEGWAKIAATAAPVEGEQAEETTRKLYEALRKDDQSPAVAREWAYRDTDTTPPEVKAKLEEEMRKSSVFGGKHSSFAHRLSTGTSQEEMFDATSTLLSAASAIPRHPTPSHAISRHPTCLPSLPVSQAQGAMLSARMARGQRASRTRQPIQQQQARACSPTPCTPKSAPSSTPHRPPPTLASPCFPHTTCMPV